MFKNLIPVSLVLAILPGKSFSQKAEETFKKVAATLDNISSIQYESYREISNLEDNYFSSNTGTSYFEYDPSKKGKLSRFQMSSDKTRQIFNGTEYYLLFNAEKTYEGGKKEVSSLSNLSLLYNSITTLRISLPLIANDGSIPKSVKDTLIDAKNFKLLKFELKNKGLEFPAGFITFTAEVTRYYDLVIDPTTYLPYMIVDRNSIKKDKYFTKTVFTNINTKPAAPAPQSWFISDYQDYSLKKEEQEKPMISIGSKTPEWILPLLNKSTQDSLQSVTLKGKKTVMEFWIKNCGYCMLAFPEMKALQNEFGSKANILSVNSYEERDDVNFFYNREKPAYQMVYGGEALANKLGIYSYPAVVVTDEKGIVIYTSRGFNRSEIEKVLGK